MDFLQEHWLWILEAIIVAVIILALWGGPKWQLTSLPADYDADKRLDLENKLRTTLAQIIGGVVILVGLYFTWQTLNLNREGQVTERLHERLNN